MIKQQELPTVFVIDPDVATANAIRELVMTLNLPCRTFPSGREFFAAYADAAPGCLVSEAKMPDMSGLQIQRRLAKLGAVLPQVFLLPHGDVWLAVELMRGGAVHYLQKPFRPLELLRAIDEALDRGQVRRKAQQRQKRLIEGIAGLTAKERSVVRLLGEGLEIKQIAGELGDSRRTVELRRCSLMKKLGLKSPTALLRFALLAMRNGRQYLDSPQLDYAGPTAPRHAQRP